jgi:hypothetical protein
VAVVRRPLQHLHSRNKQLSTSSNRRCRESRRAVCPANIPYPLPCPLAAATRLAGQHHPSSHCATSVAVDMQSLGTLLHVVAKRHVVLRSGLCSAPLVRCMLACRLSTWAGCPALTWSSQSRRSSRAGQGCHPAACSPASGHDGTHPGVMQQYRVQSRLL